MAGSTGLAKVMMPVPDPHPDVFDREWPLRVADIDREGRLKFDAATRHIQDIGSDQLREMGFEETHPLWIVRRTMLDMIEPVEFKDMLRMRRWCSGTSNRWCEMRVRIDGRKGGLVESEAFWININRETQGPARISDDFIEGLQRTTDVDRLRWKSYLKAGSREDAVEVRDYPVRVSDIDIFDHMNNSVYWSVIEDYLHGHPELRQQAAAGDHRARRRGGARRQVGDRFARAPARIDRTVRLRTGGSHCYNAHICRRRRDQSRRVPLRALTPRI